MIFYICHDDKVVRPSEAVPPGPASPHPRDTPPAPRGRIANTSTEFRLTDDDNVGGGP
jgi:hypothetical protein